MLKLLYPRPTFHACLFESCEIVIIKSFQIFVNIFDDKLVTYLWDSSLDLK